MGMMTQEEAKVFCLKHVPNGAFKKKDAEEWCRYINYIVGKDVCTIEPADPDMWYPEEEMYGIYMRPH